MIQCLKIQDLDKCEEEVKGKEAERAKKPGQEDRAVKQQGDVGGGREKLVGGVMNSYTQNPNPAVRPGPSVDEFFPILKILIK